ARDRGADRLWLGTYQHNAQALGFYRAMGFETAGTRTFQVGDGVYDDFVLALTL
ncbi:MAG: GNAT family N-acetyltransferase, partial [Pseudomonadota bacterium]